MQITVTTLTGENLFGPEALQGGLTVADLLKRFEDENKVFNLVYEAKVLPSSTVLGTLPSPAQLSTVAYDPKPRSMDDEQCDRYKTEYIEDAMSGGTKLRGTSNTPVSNMRIASNTKASATYTLALPETMRMGRFGVLRERNGPTLVSVMTMGEFSTMSDER